MFSTEIDLSTAFKEILPSTKWAEALVYEEVTGILGIPDFVLVKPAIKKTITIGIELKLHNWKRAMQQAYKYKAFCNSSFVIMDAAFIQPAENNLSEFIKYNIGLASIDAATSRLKFYYNPKKQEPYFNELYSKLLKKIAIPT
jgi:hypothetical protein